MDTIDTLIDGIRDYLAVRNTRLHEAIENVDKGDEACKFDVYQLQGEIKAYNRILSKLTQIPRGKL
jgi:hypothetical protein